MRVTNWLLLCGSLCLLAAAVTTVSHSRMEEDPYEAEDCYEFQSCFMRWKKHREELVNKVETLFDKLLRLPHLLKCRWFVQWAAVFFALVFAGIHKWRGRSGAVFVTAWLGVLSLYAADYVLTALYEPSVRESVIEVRSLVLADKQLQTSMVAHPCDEPPFVGIDKTVDEMESKIDSLLPLEWWDHPLELEPNEEELRKQREWLRSVYGRLKIKLADPIDVVHTVKLPKEQANKLAKGQGRTVLRVDL